MEHQPVSPATETRVLLDKDLNAAAIGAADPYTPSPVDEKTPLLVSRAGNDRSLTAQKARRKNVDDSLLGTFCAWV